jgi:hypothetical protein
VVSGSLNDDQAACSIIMDRSTEIFDQFERPYFLSDSVAITVQVWLFVPHISLEMMTSHIEIIEKRFIGTRTVCARHLGEKRLRN